jgi:hypothetical protein
MARRCLGLHAGLIGDDRYLFLYALWRDVVRDRALSRLTLPRNLFPYALWRDVVWEVAIYVTFVAGLVFLYALWRDAVWDAPRPT